MNLRDLEYLTAVAKFRHFGRAAEHCHVSQPSLSAQIKKLEETLGIVLFERTNKRVMLTPAGEQVLQQAQAVLRHAEEIREIGRQASDPLSGRLKLGIIPTMAPYFLPRILPVLQTHFPKLEVDLFEGQTRHIVEQLKRGELDVILLALPVGDDVLREVPLCEEPFLLAVPEDHALAARKAIAVDDLAGEDVLLLEDGHCLRDQALEVCQVAGANEHINARATSLETLRQMVANGLGITLMPGQAVPVHTSDGLRYIPFRSPAPYRTVGFAWRKSTPREALLIQLTEILGRTLGAASSVKKRTGSI